MDIERKTCNIWTWKRYLFLDISSTNTDTHVPSLYQWVERRSIEVFWLCLNHFRTSVSAFSSSAKHLPLSCEPLYATNTSHRKQETFLTNILCIYSFCPHKKSVQQNAALRQYNTQALSPFWLLKPASEHVYACLIPRLTWTWTVLLPSDTHRKPVTSTMAILLPFVTYLLTSLRIILTSTYRSPIFLSFMRYICTVHLILLHSIPII
jgi:hypothetical protein